MIVMSEAHEQRDEKYYEGRMMAVRRKKTDQPGEIALELTVGDVKDLLDMHARLVAETIEQRANLLALSYLVEDVLAALRQEDPEDVHARFLNLRDEYVAKLKGHP